MLVAASKMDALQDGEKSAALRTVAEGLGLPFFEISSVTGQGIEALKFALAERVLAPVH
jgi:GTP-binding protein